MLPGLTGCGLLPFRKKTKKRKNGKTENRKNLEENRKQKMVEKRSKIALFSFFTKIKV
jgi:hypothetical protein